MSSYDSLYMYTKSISEVKTRDDIFIGSTIFNKQVSLPLIPSPMMDIICDTFIDACLEYGIYAIIPRFYKTEDLIEFCKRYKNNVAYSIGVNGDDFLKKLDPLYHLGARNFCIDVANSSSYKVYHSICILKANYNDCKFIVGNAMSSTGVDFYLNQPITENIEGIRLGVAGGLACTTKNATGMWRPETDIIKECKEGKLNSFHQIKLIADGGIREPGHFCKAIGLGADFVMAGSIFAACKESAARIHTIDGKQYKVFRGSASYENQYLYKENPRYIEGAKKLIPYENLSFKELIDSYSDGLKSSMSYANAINFNTYRKNVIFEKI